jgi:exonuclease SbcC
VRTTGVNDESVVELTFDHEGHSYVARRTVSGGGKTTKRDAMITADGLQVATGARDVERYVQQVIGMNEKGFLASVFAEQKQLAALSSQTAGERRKLVLDLLGITPIESAVKAVRVDARSADTTLKSLQTVASDLATLETERDDAAAAAVAARTEAEEAVKVAAVATEKAAAARDRHEAMARQLEVGQSVAKHHAQLAARVEALTAEAAELATAEARLAQLGDTAATVAVARAEYEAVRVLLEARERFDKADAAYRALEPAESRGSGDSEEEPEYPSDGVAVAARRAASDAAAAVAGLEATAAARAEALATAAAALEKADALDAGAECPTCGQTLGDAFGEVRAHRAEDVATAQEALDRAKLELSAARASARDADTTAAAAERALAEARSVWQREANQRAARRDARVAVRAAAELVNAAEAACDARRADLRNVKVEVARAALTDAEANDRLSAELRGQLGRAVAVASDLAAAKESEHEVAGQLAALRAEAKSAGLTAAAVAEAFEQRQSAATAATAADAASRAAGEDAARAEAKAAATAVAAERAAEQHARIEPQAVEARLLGRLGELLGAFKDHEAASVGPRLAGHARALFDDMTDGIYSGLELTENFEVRLTDANRTFDLKRFSGSEVDVANLALRIAISECVTLQSGGAVGLLVLDEVFGPLDASRRARVLDALNNLQSRFSQVLVVTHDDDVKAQLPSAIEVRVTGERRSTATVV